MMVLMVLITYLECAMELLWTSTAELHDACVLYIRYTGIVFKVLPYNHANILDTNVCIFAQDKMMNIVQAHA